MTRTVSSTYLPEAPVSSHETIRPEKLQGTVRAQNTLYEQLRGGVIMDTDSAGVITSTSQVARYRPRVQGTTDGVGSLQVSIDVQSDSGCTFRVDSSVDFNAVAISGGTNGWVNVGTLDIDASGEYEDITAQLTTPGGTIRSICAKHVRTAATLPAAATDFAYDDEYIPLSEDLFDAGEPLSATKVRLVSENFIKLYEHRQSMVLASAYPVAPVTDDSADVPVLMPREARSGQAATLRVHVRRRWTGSFVGVQVGRITVALRGDSAQDITISGGSWEWITLDLDVGVSTSVDIASLLVIVSEHVEIDAISAYWRDLSYA